MGVSHLIRFGDTPSRCPDQEVEKLLAKADPDGVILLERKPAFAAGAKVTITDGAFRGFDAIHTGMSATDREIVLLTMLGAERRVTVPAGSLVAR